MSANILKVGHYTITVMLKGQSRKFRTANSNVTLSPSLYSLDIRPENGIPARQSA